VRLGELGGEIAAGAIVMLSFDDPGQELICELWVKVVVCKCLLIQR
jgi:hypothetical protein